MDMTPTLAHSPARPGSTLPATKTWQVCLSCFGAQLWELRAQLGGPQAQLEEHSPFFLFSRGLLCFGRNDSSES